MAADTSFAERYYATAHINAQILIFRDFTASLQILPSQTPAARPPISQAHLRTLHAMRRDIVQTVKQVVDVVGRYAGGALLENARGRVRGFILIKNLDRRSVGRPQRWAHKAPGPPGSSARDEDGDRERDREHERDRESVAAAAAGGAGAVRRSNRKTRERGPGGGGSASLPGAAILAAQRILMIATESLDMMRGVTGVVKDSLDRADAWVGRFRTVGLQRGTRQVGAEGTSSSAANGDQEMEGSEYELQFAYMRHRRGTSSKSLFDDHDGMPSPFSGDSSYLSYAGGSSMPSTPGAGAYTPTRRAADTPRVPVQITCPVRIKRDGSEWVEEAVRRTY
ncbi:hypothetical protein D9615_002180 [Tricholomella constricta]|uniref:Uncharacterized protein n=1 Tax=Tricholomella constricta TaxID=117010 RepID=A0A8H5M9V0_9AGAR|nr:hypothetical protein D9615_002180 [Tricholomella constricta]